MLKRVDIEGDDIVTGFAYKNAMGAIESVVISDTDMLKHVVKIQADDGMQDGVYQSVYVFKEDIPKLIKALQAAYDHKETA